jgi:hypothetical protein
VAAEGSQAGIGGGCRAALDEPLVLTALYIVLFDHLVWRGMLADRQAARELDGDDVLWGHLLVRLPQNA